MQVSSFFRDIGNCGEIFNDKCVRHLACSYYVCFKTVCNGGFHVRCRQINYWSFVFETLSCTICMEKYRCLQIGWTRNFHHCYTLITIDNLWPHIRGQVAFVHFTDQKKISWCRQIWKVTSPINFSFQVTCRFKLEVSITLSIKFWPENFGM